MEMFSLKNKLIIITGASGLLGQEHAKAVAKAGGIPVLIDLDIKKLKKQAENIFNLFGIKCGLYQIDITKEESIKNNCKVIKKAYGGIHGLINNAANNPKVENKNQNFSRLENFKLENWNEDLSVSLTGSFLCSKYYGFEISKNRKGGSIINVSSDLGLIAPNQTLYKISGRSKNNQSVKPISYSVMKHGIIGLTKYISTYWAEDNVRCNAICPGGVYNNQPKEFVEALSKLIPMGRMAEKDEYQGLIIYLLSDASSYINGSIISADGGRTVW